VSEGTRAHGRENRERLRVAAVAAAAAASAPAAVVIVVVAASAAVFVVVVVVVVVGGRGGGRRRRENHSIIRERSCMPRIFLCPFPIDSSTLPSPCPLTIML